MNIQTREQQSIKHYGFQSGVWDLKGSLREFQGVFSETRD